MNDGSAKQQIVERIKNANNILVSVSTNPSVDSLSAALALTMMLNKMDKHATAVFSGVVPPAISFLHPEKTFEGTVDSLRDFIIALDKEKADRLRYKVEDDVVRIFITPYRTTITEKDLEFSQGDFNVELVVALGVEKKDTLDKAIVAHGRILHDATVVTINANDTRSSLGAIDWHDPNASSLCEMLMALSEALQPGLIDEPTATALLTGIVAATERFSNRNTTPKVMTMSAQLMAAGANQQLIATKLEEGNELPAPHGDGSTPLKEDTGSRVAKGEAAAKTESEPKKKANDGEMVVEHGPPPAAPSLNLPPPEPSESAVEAAEDALAEALSAKGVPPAAPSMSELDQALQQEANGPQPSQEEPINPGLPPAPAADTKPSWMSSRLEPPTMGGTLNATSEEALEDKLAQEDRDRRHVLLSHDAPSGAPATDKPPAFNAFDMQYEEAPLPDMSAPEQASQPPAADLASAPPPSFGEVPPAAAPPQQQPKTLAELEAEAHAKAAEQLAQPADNASTDLDQARQAVSEALNGGGAPEPFAAPAAPQPAAPAPEASPMPPMPPMPPDLSALPPLPPEPPMPQPPVEPPQPQQPAPPATPPAPSDPGQFRIPGQ